MHDVRFLIVDAEDFVKGLEDRGLKMHGHVWWRDQAKVTVTGRYVVLRQMPEHFPGKRFVVMTWVFDAGANEIARFETVSFDSFEDARSAVERAVADEAIVFTKEYDVRCWIYLVGSSKIVVYKSLVDMCIVRMANDEAIEIVKSVGVKAIVREPELVFLAGVRA